MSSPARRPAPRRAGAPGPAPAPPGRPRRRRFEPPIDPASWSGAIVIMLGVGVLVWVVQIVNAYDDYHLNRFGLQPRHVSGLWGVLTMPFLHASYRHLLSNTAPLVLIGWVVLLAGLRTWVIVTAIVVVVGGVLTWLVAPGDTVIVGASAMVFGWLGYLLARAYFSRKVVWIVVAALVLLFFGTLLYGLIPLSHSHESWQAHVCGFLAGVGAGALLHPRGGESRRFRRTAVS